MKKYIVVLVLCLAFLAPALIAKDEVIFESALKDAVFIPFHGTDENTIGIRWGWWTIKFDNGAIITIHRGLGDDATNDIWWVGKTYIVTKNRYGFNAKLKEDAPAK
jgi:hypothetical protein